MFTPLNIGTQKGAPSVNFSPIAAPPEVSGKNSIGIPEADMAKYRAEQPDPGKASFKNFVYNVKKLPGALYDLGNKLTSGVGEDIAGAIGGNAAVAQQQKLQDIDRNYVTTILDLRKEAQAKGDQARVDYYDTMIKNYKPINSDQTLKEMFPALAKSNKEIAGDFVGLATTIIGAGALPAVGAAAAPAETILGGAAKGALEAGKQGLIYGAGSGTSRGLKENLDTKDIVEKAAMNAAGDAVLFGAGGALLGGVSGGLTGRAIRKQQLVDELTNNPELVAKYDLNNAGEAVKNPQAAELVRQGLPEKQVAVVKNASEVDKAKFREMVGLADTASKDARAIERPTDIVGNTIVDRTKHLLGQVKSAGQEVDKAATGLAGKKVDPTPAVNTFITNLEDMGVSFKNGVPDFAASDIEGIKPAEDLIKKVVTRMNSVQFDGLEIHKLKKFIDEQVTFGRTGEGLTGQTERVLKGLRRNLDGILDANFENYNIANTAYAKARDLLDDTQTILGKHFNPNNGAVRAGAVARRVLGNSANRGDIIEYLGKLDKYFKETGGKGGDDIITQTVFADMLEDIYGTQATTGLQGQVQRGLEKAGDVGRTLLEGKPVAAAGKVAGHAYEAVRGLSDEAKIKALKALIGL